MGKNRVRRRDEPEVWANMTFSSKYCQTFPKRCRNSCILYSRQYLEDLGVPCDNHHRNYILPLGFLHDHDAGDNSYLCKWSSRQTPQTRHSNTSKAHEDQEAQKRAICGGINLWKPFALSLKEKHQIVAGSRNNRHDPFLGHQGSHSCSLRTRKFSLCISEILQRTGKRDCEKVGTVQEHCAHKTCSVSPRVHC